MAGTWKIRLFGTNSSIPTIDANSEVSLAALGQDTANWDEFTVFGMSPNRKFIGESDERTGGIVVHRGKQYRSYTLNFIMFKFPADMGKLETLMNILSKRYIFLWSDTSSNGGYDFEGSGHGSGDHSECVHLHTSGKCISITVTGTIEDAYENGGKIFRPAARKTYPIPTA